MKRPKVNEDLCFVCQKELPIFKATKNGKEEFLLCDKCKQIVINQNQTSHRIDFALMYPDNGTKIFSETLGFRSKTPEIRINKL